MLCSCSPVLLYCCSVLNFCMFTSPFRRTESLKRLTVHRDSTQLSLTAHPAEYHGARIFLVLPPFYRSPLRRQLGRPFFAPQPCRYSKSSRYSESTCTAVETIGFARPIRFAHAPTLNPIGRGAHQPRNLCLTAPIHSMRSSTIHCHSCMHITFS